MSTLTDTESMTSGHSTVSWGAVVAGGMVAAALSLLLLALGVGLGLSSISPWAGEGVSAGTFKVGTGIYLVAVAMLASTVGGYLAGRMRTTWSGVHHDELYFRDTAHGLLAWAFATILSATVLGAAATHIVGGAASGVLPAVATSAAAANPTDTYVDTLLRSEPTTNNAASAPASADQSSAAGNPGAVSSSQGSRGSVSNAEVGRLIAPMVSKGGEISVADRAYLNKAVAARTGLSQAEAEKRVSDVIAQAKKAIDDTRKATAKFMLWLVGAMLAGAVASMLGANEGGVLRDSKWWEPGWRASHARNH